MLRNYIYAAFIICSAVVLSGCGQSAQTTSVYKETVVVEQPVHTSDKTYMDTGFEVVE